MKIINKPTGSNQVGSHHDKQAHFNTEQLARPDIEESVIGCLLIDSKSINRILEILKPEDFTKKEFIIIYTAILKLYEKKHPIDYLIIADFINQNMSEQWCWNDISLLLVEIIKNTPTAHNILHYAKIIKDNAIRRLLVIKAKEIANDIIQTDSVSDCFYITDTMHAEYQQLKQHYNINTTPKLHVIDLLEFLKTDLPPRDLILNPWLPTAGLCMLHAYRGIGKTHVSLGIAYAVAKGGEFLGWQASKPRGVLYIDGEMPAAALQERLARINLMNGDPLLPAKLFIITPDLQPFGMPNLATSEGQAIIEPYITDEVDLIIVDNLSCLAGSIKENDSTDWMPIQSWALKLRARRKSVLLIHHSGKTGTQRGTSKKEDILDVVITLKRPNDYEPPQGSRFIVEFEKSRGFYGDEAKPFEAQLCNDGDNQCWTIKSLEESTYEKVVTMLNNGLEQKDIAEELKINKSTVSRHAKAARDAGMVTK